MCGPYPADSQKAIPMEVMMVASQKTLAKEAVFGRWGQPWREVLLQNVENSANLVLGDLSGICI